MTKDSKFHQDISKAKKYYKKKIEQRPTRSIDSEDDKFRYLDSETLKISKLSARIDFLKSTLNRKKVTKKIKKRNKVSEKKKEEPKDNIQIFSKKNKDVNGNPIINFLSDDLNLSENFVILKDFEINSKLFIAGNINKLPSQLVKILKEKKLIKSNEIIKNSKETNNQTFFVKETFGLSEVKRSKLRNKKNFNEK